MVETVSPGTSALEELITEAAVDPRALDSAKHRAAVEETIALLDRGEVRTAEKIDGEWQVNTWVQHAIKQYFHIAPFTTERAGPMEYHDRIPIKHNLAERGIRVLPGSIVRYGSYIEPGVIVALGFVNLGSYVQTGALVDAWSTVGSAAQIGRDVHLAGGVGIGGVLEPPGARPVIIEDGAFIGSRSIIVEGVVVEERAVIAAQTCLTGSTHIIDVTGDEPVTYKGRVPADSVVVPGTRTRKFPAGEYQVSCALIIGKRGDTTDHKLRFNDDLRDFSFA
ncbi:MAG TPA: 2,3,4,5-tetrahydropyridine-2,6-dicarboxylate N-succinyltransferase [Jatrophihabitans sp.]|jgi:2,3,4,5-tetrahydropyridine-2-carboxylate N-succinyltransferase|nr:2,3,4,5-tetrahydropyridine-2,6-dicarboxylate N-succinyltransferase [Jatrophihabitans sp.]